MKPGRFITFEGPEGAGKSTQAARLRAFLLEKGVEVVSAREPGGTKVGEAIRGVLQYNEAGEPPVPEAEVLLFEASRAQLVRQVFLPALERGAWVVSDRFYDSTSATLGEINRFATAGRVPDMTFLLDLDVAEGMRRVASRAEKVRYDRIEAEELAFHEKVRTGYLELAKAEPGRFRVIDASRGEDAVAEEIRRIVGEAFFA